MGIGERFRVCGGLGPRLRGDDRGFLQTRFWINGGVDSCFRRNDNIDAGMIRAGGVDREF